MKRDPGSEDGSLFSAVRRRGSRFSVALIAVATLALAGALAGPHSGRAAGVVQAGHTASSVEGLAKAGKHCSATASALYRACGFEVEDDYWVTYAKCTNESDAADREECLSDARASRREAAANCGDEYEGRRKACRKLGEGRYDPDFDEELFDDDFRALTNPNRYYPLTIGSRWEFRSSTETVTVEVLDQTKSIDDVTCIVVRDLVYSDGKLKEATDDWYAMAKDGNAWYCGEEVKNFESFPGDAPSLPELVSIDGSFKAGRDLDKPGIIFLAEPTEGATYLEEFSLGNAEDVTEILATDYSYGDDDDLDEFVPRDLAELLCDGDCVVTKNYSLLEPGVIERKYYAPGIGVFLEVAPDAGEVLRLTACNVDPRCSGL